MLYRLTRPWMSACAFWRAQTSSGSVQPATSPATPQARVAPRPVQSAVRRFRWLLLAGGLFAGAAMAQSADLVVNHADSPDPGPAGGIFTYTLRIDNNGPNGATGVTLVDTLPAGSTFIDVNTTAGTCNQAGGTVNCALGNIAFNTNQTVTIRVRLPSAGVWTNTATASSATSDPNTSNNVNSVQDTTATQAADLALVATPSAANVVAGQAYSYALQAANNGPNAADGSQRITFTVPSGASITAAPSGSGWSCTPSSGYPLSSGTVTCTRTGTLANGASASVLTVPAVSNVNGTVTAAFAIDGIKPDNSAMPDGNTSNNTTSADVTSASGADVSITKTASSSNVAQGANVVYTLTPRLNGGVSLVGQPVTVTDTLGAGLTFVSAVGTGWTCDATITCTRTEYTGANFTNMPVITVTATANSAGTLGNTAGVSTLLSDPVPGNNSASFNVTASNDADMQLTKTASINPVVPGQAFNYTLTARNAGPLAVPNGQAITISDVVPAGVTLNSLVSATGWTCDALPFVGNGVAAWNCTRSTGLNANSNAPAVTVSAVLASAGTVTNNACVALGVGARVDSNGANNCVGVGVTATATQADLRVVSKTAAPDPVVAGQNLTYVITVDNVGPAAASNVIVSDTLASLVNTGGFQSAVASQGSCTPNGVTNGTSQNLSCNLGTLNSGAQATVTVVVRPSIAVTGPRTNTATVRSPDVGDPNQANNSGSVTSQVTAIVDVTAAKTATPSTVAAGAPITFVATIGNTGPSTAQTVQMVDTLPSNAAFIDVVSVSGGGSCAPIAAGTVGGTLTCNWASINSGTQQTVNYRMRPLGSATGSTVVNSVAATTATTESNTANNSATTSTPVTAAQLDILVNKVDSSDPVDLGQSTTYTITVNNSGPSFGTNVVMTDVFPAPGSSPTATFSYQGALTVNAGGACTEPTVGATSGTLICSFPGLSSGQSATITYAMRAETLTVAGATSGTAFNQASVVVEETETTLANNVVTHDTTARRFTVATDLALSKTAAAGPLAAGAPIDYTLVVTNNGPLASNGAQVVDTLPPGVNFVSAAGCVNSAGTVRCAVGALAVGASRTFTISTTLASPYNGARPLVNTATLDAPGDTNPSNNTSSATTTVSNLPVSGIPTLSEWGLILLAALLGLMAWQHPAIGRRR
ncbi:IPTL-CTERM sorting domain-containing protein [Acidovorax sp. Root275]|uniref:IPTL-CTERM sorting domain-containing protein n=1 Tax=Acidovorax sp. Root275 TaxID=1736508 RepID=UPI000A4A3AFF|nr:IPTL-CTERM sorting domain-containing protein [Acidovorax sp. Root275]